MKNLIWLFLAVGCGGSDLTTVKSTPRPEPAQGGFQAEPPTIEGWVNFGVPTYVSPIQRSIIIAGAGGSIGQLLIKGVSGESQVDRVQIEYMDKSTKGVQLNKRFVPGDGQVIELKEDRPIDKIIIYVDPDSGGTFEIFGA